MKIAIFADVHGNLEALQAFIEATGGQQVDKYIFLGDIVGYGPNPNECIAMLRELPGLEMVLGNHDCAVLWKTSPFTMSGYARDAIFWTMERLTRENLNILQSLRFKLVQGDICYCHASPDRPDSWVYLNSKAEAYRAFISTRFHVCFVGHTHWPRIICLDQSGHISEEKVKPGKQLLLRDERRYIINSGSIGQPRDGSADSSFCLFDDQKKTVVFQRCSYDNDKTAAKIREAGLPQILAIRLKKGR